MKKGTRTTLIVLGVIALVFIFFAFFTETEIRIEVNTNSKDTTSEYVSFEECHLREMTKCGATKGCDNASYEYCATLGLPESE
tara:strand:- start:576 stop:824 length:249 start_codon:yes stop_codon:yes gene_type:complete